MKILLIALLAASAAESLVEQLASPLNDYNLSYDSREQTMVFARSQADFVNAKIFISHRDGEHWSVPQPISFSDDRYSDSDPWLTPDGRTLFFISDRPAPGRAAERTDYDIWRSDLTDNGWSVPVHLGATVNSPGQELGPELHGGILYFSAAKKSGLGGLDIYQARSSGHSFESPELLEGGINTAASESDFTLRHDGKAAMFWRSRGERGLLYIVHRHGDAWSEPVELPATINVGPFNFTPSFNRDGTQVRFSSNLERPGQDKGLADIYEKALPPENWRSAKRP